MRDKIFQLSLVVLIAFVIWACEETVLKPLSYGEKPDPVTNYRIESLAGGAKITFDLPSSDDLLYVKAEYELDGGTVREAKSSIYKNFLTIDGFASAGEYDVTIYAVAKGEVLSDPTRIKVTTSTPPYLTTFNSLEMIPVFGGINISFENRNRGDLAIQVLVVDSTDNWSPVQTYYTNSMQGNFSVRGFDTIQYSFGALVRDRWGNLSDTLSGIFKPMFESLIDHSTFAALKQLPGDVWQAHTGASHLVIERAWDGNISTEFHTSPNSGMPQSFSIDMGKKVKLSRFKYHQRATTRWNAGNPKYFELWGSNNPDTDGTWESWTKIGEFESIKPSGQPLGTNSPEDTAKAIEGEDFEVPITTPAFQYYRWKTIRTWANMTYVSIGELTFWGSVVTE